MKMSTKGRYGLRAIVDIASRKPEEASSITGIAGRQGISEAYLEQLMRSLRKAGLVESTRGAGGGYKLARPAEEISIGDVLRALEGDLRAVSCRGDAEEGGCSGSSICVTKYVWKRINDAIEQTVDSIMLSELVSESIKLRETKGTVPVESCQ